MLASEYIRRIRPWQEMEQIQREMNRLFESFDTGSAKPFPPINLWANKDSVYVTTELPGCTSETIDLSVTGDALTIKGSRSEEKIKEGEVYHRRERKCGEFERTVQLPFVVNPDNVEARFNTGVLTVKLMRSEADKPRTIQIKTA